MEFITSWERKGALIARRETLLDLLKEKFVEVPSTVVQQVEAIASKGELEELLRKLIHADSFAEMGLDGAKK